MIALVVCPTNFLESNLVCLQKKCYMNYLTIGKIIGLESAEQRGFGTSYVTQKLSTRRFQEHGLAFKTNISSPSV